MAQLIDPKAPDRFTEPLELWRGRTRDEHLSPASIVALTAPMGPKWRTWMMSPMRDECAVGGRMAPLHNDLSGVETRRPVMIELDITEENIVIAPPERPLEELKGKHFPG